MGDYLSRQQAPIIWGPGSHGSGNDFSGAFRREHVISRLRLSFRQITMIAMCRIPHVSECPPNSLNLGLLMQTGCVRSDTGPQLS